MVGNPDEVSRYSGGVVGSDWWPASLPMSSCMATSSCSSLRCCWSNLCISASKRRFCSLSLSYSKRFFSNYNLGVSTFPPSSFIVRKCNSGQLGQKPLEVCSNTASEDWAYQLNFVHGLASTLLAWLQMMPPLRDTVRRKGGPVPPLKRLPSLGVD